MAVVLVVVAPATLAAKDQPMSSHVDPIVQSWEQAQFGGLAVLPACSSFAVDRGNPMTGPSMLVIKLDAGCVVPWHWHTAREELMMISGTGKIEFPDLPAHAVHQGGYVLLPAKHDHQMSCQTDCVFFDAISGKFDIHYVDSSGQEIPVAQALDAVSEQPAMTQ
jgi:quercetin dioxygenase-like cupin family protein